MSKEELLMLLMLYGISAEKIGDVLVSEIINQINRGAPIIRSIDNALEKTGFIKNYYANLIDTIGIAAYLGYGISSSVASSTVSTSKNSSTFKNSTSTSNQPATQQIKTAKELAMERGLVPTIIIGDNIKNKILSESWTSDKMNLSTRLHGTEAKMRQAIIDTLSAGMRQGKTVKDMAMDLYDGYNNGKQVIRSAELPDYLKKVKSVARSAANGDLSIIREFNKAIDKASISIDKLASKELKAAYKQVLDAAKDLDIKVMEKAAWVAVQEKSRYYADRIATTEMSRAWSDGFFAKNANDIRVIGYKWTLSSKHPRFDICDFHATVNLYGMGPGGYPKNKVPPHPAHPYCHCHLEVIFKNEAEIGEFNANAGKEWLQKQSEYDRQQLLGIEGNKVFENGGNWQEYLRNWNRHGDPKSRFVAKDFELQNIADNRIPEGSYNLKIRKQVQDRHIEGTKGYGDYLEQLSKIGLKPGKISYPDPQGLINKYHRHGEAEINPSDGSIREKVFTNEIVGQYWNNQKQQYIDTKAFRIVYSKKGTHIFPVWDGTKE